MIYATSMLQISKGLMFAGKKKIKKGICLVMPGKVDVKFGASVTMMFCFHKMQMIFIKSNLEVVDKVTLRPWKITYTPKDKCCYVIESLPKTFDNIKIGDKIEIKV